MKKNTYLIKMILSICCFLTVTLTSIKAQQTTPISLSDIRVANQIFIEHKNQKEIIETSNLIIDQLKTQNVFYENLVQNKDSIIYHKDEMYELSNKKHSYVVANYEQSLKSQKKQTNKYKVISFGAIILFLTSFILK